jgi:hypothetical protein
LIAMMLLVIAVPGPRVATAQVDEGQLGAWSMYFYAATFGDGPFGLQGDFQWRNWDVGTDLEQLLLRSGFTWSPGEGRVTYTLGYASITSGEFGPGDETSHENRIYQEALIRQQVGPRIHLRHRLRYEQRWVQEQDFRTRVRYGLFLDVPLNRPQMGKGTLYLSLYDEIFLNLEQNIGGGREVDIFDRNRLYGALGYVVTETLRLQGGVMLQSTSRRDKRQLQLSLHQAFR